MFPVTKVTVRLKPQPQSSKDVIRLRFLERPWRYYLQLSYHWQAFLKTVLLSAALIILPYHFVYYLAWSRSKAEILAKQDPEYTSDGMKQYIREYKRRKSEGLLEDMSKVIEAKENSEDDSSSDLAKARIPLVAESI